ncbi:MAG: hypothetical protein K9M55_02405 [Candidatus Marinimicrobia bacterium]|nr:hypothetical protein [Candidatus Neomarinimicrobiota bacterium]
MKLALFFLLFIQVAFPQSKIDLGSDALDDPDENQYMEQLLTSIFQRINIETADSTALKDRGYSQQGIESILSWQNQEGRKGSTRWLAKQLHDEDLVLMEHDLTTASSLTQCQFRQRLQYSPSLDGWRLLHKGRLWNRWGSVNILTEQDPGESQLTDHSIFTLNIDALHGFQNIILGDFHVNWGGGLILNQQGSRASLNPGSLMRKSVLTIRPHYSSRESDYFHGLASQFSFMNMRGAAFLSSRKEIGLMQDGEFREDADGIHPIGKTFQIYRSKTLGLAMERYGSGFQLYGSALYHPQERSGIDYELGFLKAFNDSHHIQVFTNGLDLNDSRILLTWTYSTKPVILSLQYRRYCSDSESSSGAMPTLLGSSAKNEGGLSFRAQIRPGKTMRIRYALETGSSVKVNSCFDYRSIQHHKIQFTRKLNHGECQLDFSRRREQPIIQGDVWNAHFTQAEIYKEALSLLHQFSPNLIYRINLKAALDGHETAWLVQQRFSGKHGLWKWTIGYTRYGVPDYVLRLSIYETSVAESFSFYTCYDDGDRCFLYLKQQTQNWFDLELKLDQTRSFDPLMPSKQLALSFQMSVVL